MISRDSANRSRGQFKLLRPTQAWMPGKHDPCRRVPPRTRLSCPHPALQMIRGPTATTGGQAPDLLLHL
jgi:hypothetical protein